VTNQIELLEKKWQKFLKLRPFFTYLPFIDFVLVAGSLALGNVHSDSDFDVIVGARQGRIFTVRFFCIVLFGFLGIRRRGVDHKGVASDKICFNHFVTPKSYRLRPPHNIYWRELYKSLVPVYGSEEAVKIFFKANDWAPRDKIFDEKYWWNTSFNPVGDISKYTAWSFRTFFEFVLRGRLGRVFEKFMKNIQTRRIEKSLKRDAGFKPRLRYDNEELEFHPDTRRIEGMVKKGLHLK